MAPFGTVFCDHFSIARFAGGSWESPAIRPLAPMPLHPAAHVFHYASSCFEGFKAYRREDGGAHIFRLRDHVERMQKSAASLRLPVPDADMLASMVVDLVRHVADEIPPPPSSLYLRPTLIGTLENIGAAASPSTEATLFVLASPVGDYFQGGTKPLKVLVDDTRSRSTEQLDAKAKYGVSQILFCPNGDVQETGASNFLLISDDEIITKPLDSTFLHGVTRASVLQLGADLGYTIHERNISVDELLGKVSGFEAALSGTAACLTPVGALVYRDREIPVRDGGSGPNTEKLRVALQDIQYGRAPDTHGWRTDVGP
jgi:branched-chain amino acid aminotransferase